MRFRFCETGSVESLRYREERSGSVIYVIKGVAVIGFKASV